jgi:hypothetical protein
MISLTIILILLLAISIVGNIIIARVVIRFGNMLSKYEEILPTVLDRLDESYKEINTVLQTPVGSDDPFIRRVVRAIKNAKDAILFAAQQISDINLQDEKKENENE